MKQALVVGLGMFGMSLARELTERGIEVIGVDRSEELADAASEFATEALALDATDESTLLELGPERRDMCICAIGEDARDASIVVTALLRQFGAPYIVSRAFDPLHERILRLVGAHDVVNPEQAFGRRLAGRLAFRGVLDQVPLGHDLEITEVALPRAFVGQTLRQLELPKRFGVYVVAVRTSDDGQDALALADPSTSLDARDVLVLAGRRGSVQAMLEQVQ